MENKNPVAHMCNLKFLKNMVLSSAQSREYHFFLTFEIRRKSIFIEKVDVHVAKSIITI